MPLILSNRFVNGSVADAVPVDGNDQTIQAYINNEVITADGLTQMRAPLLLRNGDPTQPNHAANKDYVDAQMPIGTMLMWPAPSAPAGGKWHLCDGGALATATYAILFGLIGVKYGGSGGSFLLPNMQGRFPIGLDTTKAAFDTVGEAGGTFTVPVPDHHHHMAHDHGSFASTVNSVDHTHSVNPASLTTTSVGAHDHDISWVQDLAHAGGDGARLVGYVGSGLHAATSTEPAHTHTVDIPATTSTVNSVDHTHTIDVPNYPSGAAGSAPAAVGNTSAVASYTGVTVGNNMIQPYLTVNFIIRII